VLPASFVKPLILAAFFLMDPTEKGKLAETLEKIGGQMVYAKITKVQNTATTKEEAPDLKMKI